MVFIKSDSLNDCGLQKRFDTKTVKKIKHYVLLWKISVPWNKTTDFTLIKSNCINYTLHFTVYHSRGYIFIFNLWADFLPFDLTKKNISYDPKIEKEFYK